MSFDFNIKLKAYFDYPSADWKKDYHVIIEIINMESFGIEYNLICTEREMDLLNPDAWKDENLIGFGEVYIPGPGVYRLTSDEILKNWTWFKNLPCTTGSDEVRKRFFYFIEFRITKKIENSTITPITENNFIFEIINKYVNVSHQKLEYASDSQILCMKAIGHYSIAAVLGTLTPICVPCGVIAAATVLKAIQENYASQTLNTLARDPIEFDKNYNKIHDPSSLIRKFKVEGLFPVHIKRFSDRYNKIDAYFKSFDITYNRFFSSLAAGNKRSAKIQKKRAIGLTELMEENILKLKSHLLKIKKSDEEFKKANIREDQIEKALKEVKERGLTEEFKEKLTRQGLHKDMIEKINESSKRLHKEAIKREIFPSFQGLYRQILDGYMIKKERIKDIKRVEGLSKKGLSRRLLKEGLISYNDYSKNKKM